MLVWVLRYCFLKRRRFIGFPRWDRPFWYRLGWNIVRYCKIISYSLLLVFCYLLNPILKQAILLSLSNVIFMIIESLIKLFLSYITSSNFLANIIKSQPMETIKLWGLQKINREEEFKIKAVFSAIVVLK